MRLAGWGLAVSCLMLAACTQGTSPGPASLASLRAMELAEVCRIDEALDALDRELDAADPGSLRFAVALQEKAVLYRDTNADEDAGSLEQRLADLKGLPPDEVRGETLRDVAALRQRRAAINGEPTC
ncbi:MAG: hypothetical protein ACOCYE_03400 [Pseudomonadota bacterium]